LDGCKQRRDLTVVTRGDGLREGVRGGVNKRDIGWVSEGDCVQCKPRSDACCGSRTSVLCDWAL